MASHEPSCPASRSPWKAMRYESYCSLLLSAASSYNTLCTKGETCMIAPLPRHQREMFMHMTWLTMGMITSMTSTIWIVILLISKSMFISSIPGPCTLIMDLCQGKLTSQQWHSLQQDARATWTYFLMRPRLSSLVYARVLESE